MTNLVFYCWVFFLIGNCIFFQCTNAIDSLAIYPYATETRQPISLDGVWNFRITNYSLPKDYGFSEEWYNKSLDQIDGNYERMPVPSSFNDITESRYLRDFFGWSWYDRKFFLPPSFSKSTNDLILRFGSVNYDAEVWLNGKHVLSHHGGHLPFQGIITDFVIPGQENHISVAVNNELTAQTIPPGSYKLYNDSRIDNAKYSIATMGFDFFNYAGIQRPVTIYLVPKIRIVDITIKTDVKSESQATISYDLSINAPNASLDQYTLNVDLYDKEGNPVNTIKNSFSSSINVKNPKLWWPFTMDPDPGYMYRMAFTLLHKDEIVDRYYQNVGIRDIKVDEKNFYVNGKPFYFRGFGKHEEYDIRGRALDQVMIMKDFNLIKWIGANSFRTSHYPYSEQIMDEADKQGIVVIDECPAVGLKSFDDNMLKQHFKFIDELIDRDKNRPSVFMWSIANEPQSGSPAADKYFEKVYDETKKKDDRLVTAAINNRNDDNLYKIVDIIMINMYEGWYINPGYPQVIQTGLLDRIIEKYDRYKKPIMISEYGADTISGLHDEPAKMFSEDYQVEILIEHHKAFDILRSKGFFIGEHIWNFADFMTEPTLTRVGGNKKGIFTRQRQPKTAARVLRCRYWELSNVTYLTKHRQGFSYCPEMNYV